MNMHLAGSVRSAQKRPATSPAPVMHGQPGPPSQSSAHHSNVSFPSFIILNIIHSNIE